jgi:hypothetical protein
MRGRSRCGGDHDAGAGGVSLSLGSRLWTPLPINGSVLGLTKKKIDAKIDEIIDFADVREAIDMPV